MAAVAAGTPPAPAPSPVDETPGSTPPYLHLGCYEDVGADLIIEDRALVDFAMITEVITFHEHNQRQQQHLRCFHADKTKQPVLFLIP